MQSVAFVETALAPLHLCVEGFRQSGSRQVVRRNYRPTSFLVLLANTSTWSSGLLSSLVGGRSLPTFRAPSLGSRTSRNQRKCLSPTCFSIRDLRRAAKLVAIVAVHIRQGSVFTHPSLRGMPMYVERITERIFLLGPRWSRWVVLSGNFPSVGGVCFRWWDVTCVSRLCWRWCLFSP